MSECTDPVGGYVNDNVMCVTHLCCLPDRNEALGGASNTDAKMFYYPKLGVPLARYVPQAPDFVPDWPAVMPEPTLDELKER